ncbi:wax ester/triacylglycerol synthase family O-acyltransferase [soil metagenome]
MNARRPLRAVDDVWLQMDHPDNLMIVESLMTLDAPVDPQRLRDLLTERVLERYPVFRQRPVHDAWPRATRSWEDDPDFDLGRHLIETTLPAPGDDAALQDYMAGLLSRAIDRAHPLWELHLVHGYAGGCALYSRLHHAMADGMALTRVVLSLTDDQADPDPGAPARADVLATNAGTGAIELVQRAAHLAGDLAGFTLASAPVLTHLLLARAPVGPLAAPPGHEKRAVWSAPIPVATLSAIGHRSGSTVTDVTMAALAGSLRTWLLTHGADTTHDVPTMVPVDLRPPGTPLPAELGNRFALVLLDLPVSVRTPLGRLVATQARMDAIKHSPEPRLTYGLLQMMGLTVSRARSVLTGFFAAKAVGVTTSVRGPDGPLWLAGSRVTRMLGWAPVSGDQTISTCIVGYDGHIQVGFKVDVATVPDPETLVEGFEADLAALAAATRAR